MKKEKKTWRKMRKNYGRNDKGGGFRRAERRCNEYDDRGTGRIVTKIDEKKEEEMGEQEI